MTVELSINNLLPVLPSNRLTEKRINCLNTTFVGIDFGTSTTVVSIAMLGKENEPIFVKPIELNQRLADGAIYSSYKIPSIIAWFNNNLIIGEGAFQLKFKLRHDKNIWHSFKMDLGEDVGCKYPNSELGKKHEKLTILNPKDATKVFFKYLKVQIERYVKTNSLPSHIKYAVSIPASFEANQRKDLIDSLASNGMMLDKQALIDEPNAAFLSYVSKPSVDGTYLQIPEDYYPHILVFDFGAGTCDISILEVGKDNNGVYSKNIAISKFEKLGVNDIDKLIAVDVLLPQLLRGTGINIDDFRTREINTLIIPKLLTSAERLKIKISEKISLQSSTKKLSDIIQSNDSVSLGNRIDIETRKGVLTLSDPSLSYKDFSDINEIFTIKGGSSTKRVENEIQFISIFTPINSALKKARINKEDIDYLVFVGGSSKNPFIQKSVSDYFPEADALVPSDLQAHVSSGAAIHSLIYNGFGKNIIQPITSEPIMLIVKDDDRDTIIPIVEAGTVIPSDMIRIDGLTPQKEGQKTIELPICVGNKNKVLYNVKLSDPDSNGFSIRTPVSLDIEINIDKMLIVQASAGSKKIMVEPLSPFSNAEMSTEERMRSEAERDFNIACERNGGQPTLDSLLNLHKTYKTVGMEFKAAETLEQIEESFPGNASLNNIGVHYSNAGKEDKALFFYKRDLEDSPSASAAFNIALIYKNKNANKYREYLKKACGMDSSHNAAAYCLGQLYKNEGNDVEGLKLQNDAFNNWKNKLENNSLRSFDYSWFSSCARALGKDDYAVYIEECEPKEDFNEIYNTKNLSKLKQGNDILI